MIGNRVYVGLFFRTPTALKGKELEDRSGEWLAARVLERIAREFPGGVPSLDEIILGVARQTSTPSNCARYAALLAGYPPEVPAYTSAMQSASGLAAMAAAHVHIASGGKKAVLAGGAESSSLAPLELHDARYDFSEGRRCLVDAMEEQMFGSQPSDLYGDLTVDELADNATLYHRLDAGAVRAYAEEDRDRAAAGLDNPLNRENLTPLSFTRGKREVSVERDGLSELNFTTPFADGAAACVMAGGRTAIKLSLDPLCEAVGFGMAAGDPRIGGAEAPAAVKRALAGVPPAKLGFVAAAALTASQGLGLRKELTAAGVDAKAINPYGSNLHLGNPQGASGCIAAAAAARAVDVLGCEYSLAVSIAEGGQTLAMLFKKP